MGDVTRDELIHLENRLTAEIRAGFAGINARLDLLNGRVRKGEVTEGEHNIRLQTLEREVVERREAEREDEQVEKNESDNTSITRRDVVVFSAGGTMLFTAYKLVEWAIHAIKP